MHEEIRWHCYLCRRVHVSCKKVNAWYFLAIFDEMAEKFKIEYITLIEVSSTKPEIVMHAIEKALIERVIDISKCF